MTGSALTEHGLALAAQIAGKTGCKVMGQTYNPRMARGKGRFAIDRIPYVIEQALPILKDFKNIVLVEANDPVAFFAYPNKPSMLKPAGLRGASHDLGRAKIPSPRWKRWPARSRAKPADRAAAEAGRTRKADRRADPCLDRAGDRDGDPGKRHRGRRIRHHRPRLLSADGGGRPARLAAEHGRLDRLLDAGRDRRRGGLPGPQGDLHGRRRQRDVHAAIAVDAGARRPQRRHDRVRQRIYQILRGEFDGVGAGEPGQRALDMLKIDRPDLDFVALAKGMGVPGRAVANADDFNKALAEAIAEPGPRLIEVQM